MALSVRYRGDFAPGESCNVGMDFSFVVPPGVGLSTGSLAVWTNRVPPVQSPDFTIGTVYVRGRAVYAAVTGGVEGTDYQFRFSATDTEGNVWPRTALLLCTQTS
jgi:hypothetical protein